MVTILHVFFKLPCLPTSLESSRSWTSVKTASDTDTDSPVMELPHAVKGGYCGGDTGDIERDPRDPCTHFFDVVTSNDDTPEPTSTVDDNTLVATEDVEEMLKSWASLEMSGCDDRLAVQTNQSTTSSPGLDTNSPADLDVLVAGDLGPRPAVTTHDKATQTGPRPQPATTCTGTMTANPQLVDVSVGCQKLYKLVKSSNTTTSGPFMKKLRRAQRLLKEARNKFQTERQSKLVTWTSVLSRYKDRLQYLTQSLDKKDILLSYTALNKALSENEVKDMCTAVSSARDRLMTQCKLNSALKEVVVSKCDSVTTATSSQTTPDSQN